MNKHCYYKVSGLEFEVVLPAGWDADALLPSFADFRLDSAPGDPSLALRMTNSSRHSEAKPKNLPAESFCSIRFLADAQDDSVIRPQQRLAESVYLQQQSSTIEGMVISANTASSGAERSAGAGEASLGAEPPKKKAQPKNLPAEPPKILSETFVDAGHLTLKQQGDSYIIDLEYDSLTKITHTMVCDSNFGSVIGYVNPQDKYLPMVITSFLRIAFAQAALAHECISIHASCVVLEQKAYLFLGKSGTGKSTHARQWMSAFPGCTLLNDDNPAIRIEEGKIFAYGTPWSGKTPCYKNERYPVAGIVRLSQAKGNKFTLLSGTEAFAALLPSCSSIRQDARLQESLIGTLIEITETVPVGKMECLPDTDAAKVCYKGLQI